MPAIKQDFPTSLTGQKQLTNLSPKSTLDLRTLNNQDCVIPRPLLTVVPIISPPGELDSLTFDKADLKSLLVEEKLKQSSSKSKRKGLSRSQSMRNSSQSQSAMLLRNFRQSISTENSAILKNLVLLRSSSEHSISLSGEKNDFQRLRNFSVTSKGLINRGDSFRNKSRNARSESSITSQYYCSTTPTHSSVSHLPLPTPKVVSLIDIDIARHKVLVVGASEVGKSSLITQFTTSEYICAYENSQDDENEKSVTVVLNGEESELIFVEYTAQDFLDQVKDSPSSTASYDAYIVVYSITSKRSFRKSVEIVNHLTIMDNAGSIKAAILVGNKTDLARLRNVTTKEGRSLAVAYSWKFIETSTGINHHVDDLLVGVLSQIRLKHQHQERLIKKRESVTLTFPSMFSFCVGGKTKVFIKEIFDKAVRKPRSCDNLHIL
ncbi:GTP-binding protein RAD-like [Tachypleus tridentatus]|uniref:GTP-binding protein RAD-like n=1 Tax=Tachypleus tridentatus TaxID=6853 RepID=UPI003FD1AAD7